MQPISEEPEIYDDYAPDAGSYLEEDEDGEWDWDDLDDDEQEPVSDADFEWEAIKDRNEKAPWE